MLKALAWLALRPLCASAGFAWLLHQPVHVGKNDIDTFAKLFSMNARLVQKDSRRFVLTSGAYAERANAPSIMSTAFCRP